MSLEELEKLVCHLPPEQLLEFRDWFYAFDAQQWDRELESDVQAGRLDAIAERSVAEYRAGKSTFL